VEVLQEVSQQKLCMLSSISHCNHVTSLKQSPRFHFPNNATWSVGCSSLYNVLDCSLIAHRSWVHVLSWATA
jgi:hypothetical protein